MGKPKKGKKGRQEDEFGDDDVDIDPIAQAAALEGEVSQPAVVSKSKKGKKKKKDDWDDDVADEIAALSLDSEDKVNGKVDVPIPQPKQKKKKGKKFQEESEDESESEDITDDIVAMAKPTKKGKVKGGMSAFQMLDIEDPSMSSNESSEDDTKPQTAKPAKQKSVNEDNGDEAVVQTKQSKKGKKDKKKGKKEDEDIDAILAGIEDKTTSKKGKKKKKDEEEKKEEGEEMDQEEQKSSAPPASEGLEFVDIENMTQDQIAKMFEDDIDDEDYKKKKKKEKKKKKKAEQAAAAEDDDEDDDEDAEGEEGGTVKTAAQKKKEKRERQRQQKLLDNKKEKEKGKKKDAEPAVVQPPTMTEAAKTEETAGATATAADAEKNEEKEEDEEGSKKSKKDKRKKKGEEEKKEKKKKPGSAQLKAMQEALAKVREEEERIQREEEEKERRREEAKKAKEEKERRDKERKEREKLKKKERVERLKQEGKYLTPKQKEAQRRAQLMLEAMRAQGMKVPSVGAKGEDEEKKPKRIVYDNRKKRKQQNKDASPTEETKELSPDTPSTPETGAKEFVEEKPEETKEDEIKEAWDDEDDVKDAWDASSEEEEESEKQTSEDVKVGDKDEATDEEGSEESDEESDEEESEESDSSEYSSSEESDDGMTSAEKTREKALARIAKRHETAEAKRTTDNLRSPVVCVLGHVDTGKTKILDKLRRTNVQDGEAGGITQQIGATNVPVYCIEEQTKMCKDFVKKGLQLPGLLIIDTPGHESFSNLRTRGSSLCDIAILVIDIMHGLEPQTIESLNLLKNGKTPFVVALNKIDRLFQWQSNPHGDVRNTINKQKPNTKIEFEERAQLAITQLAEQGLNAALFYENKNPKEYISLVPTSAHSGDGMGNLIALICELSQTMLAKRLAYSEELQATVMEVKALPGLGTTIDVILVNGCVTEGETIIVAGTEGPIVTTIRGLLMPQPLKELRVKNAYAKHKEVKAAQGVKIIAKELDHALAGLPMHVASKPDEIEIYKEDIGGAIKDILAGIRVQDRGVFVQASTIGSLEALLEFLRTSKINYAGINIGPVHKKDIMRASVMLEHDSQYATILAFDVKVEREAQELADSLGVRIFCADIIYHLFDQFMAYRAEVKRKKQEEFKHIAVFPCKLRILPQFIFNTRDPIVVGVVVEAGFIKEGTPLCVPGKEFVEIGRVTSIENNHKNVDMAKKGNEVSIKIEPTPGDTPKMLGRHFDEHDILVSKISRQSIDAVKEYFREEMGKGDWQLIMELKKTFQIL